MNSLNSSGRGAATAGATGSETEFRVMVYSMVEKASGSAMNLVAHSLKPPARRMQEVAL